MTLVLACAPGFSTNMQLQSVLQQYILVEVPIQQKIVYEECVERLIRRKVNTLLVTETHSEGTRLV